MELYFNNMRNAYDTLISAIRTDEMVQAVIKRQDSLVKIMEKASSIFQEQQLSGKKRILQNDNDLALTITNIGVETNFKEINYYKNLVSDTLKGDFEFHYKVYKTITDDQRSYLRDVSGNSLSILEMYLDKTKTKREYSKDKIELALSRVYNALCVYYGYQLYDTRLKREGSYEYE